MPFAEHGWTQRLSYWDRERQTHGVTYIWNLMKMLQMNLFTKQKSTHRSWNQTYGYQRGNVAWGMINQEVGIDIHTCCCSVTQLCLTLRPHGLQHARPPCPSPPSGICPSSCSLHQGCHPAISSSDAFFSFCPWSFPASGTFLMSCLFTSYDQNTGASALASFLPVSIQGWSPLRFGLISSKIGLISLLSKGCTGVFSSTTVQRHQFFGFLPSLQTYTLLYAKEIN